MNKNLKRKAHEEIVEFLKIKTDNVDIKEVKIKIQNVRNAFRKETKKVKDSKRSEAGSEEVYIPTLFQVKI